MAYLKNVFSNKRTPQREPIPGTNQVRNSSGGFSFPVDDWVRLERFLILGSAAQVARGCRDVGTRSA